MLNKRGTIIRKNDMIEFDENQDHIPNLESIIPNYYQEYEEYIGQTTNAGLCIAITNNDDIVMINATYDQIESSFLNYLPFDLNNLNDYQIENMVSMLKEMNGRVESTSYAKQFDFDNIDKTYEKDELIKLLELQLANKHTR